MESGKRNQTAQWVKTRFPQAAFEKKIRFIYLYIFDWHLPFSFHCAGADTLTRQLSCKMRPRTVFDRVLPGAGVRSWLQQQALIQVSGDPPQISAQRDCNPVGLVYRRYITLTQRWPQRAPPGQQRESRARACVKMERDRLEARAQIRSTLVDISESRCDQKGSCPRQGLGPGNAGERD